MAWNKFKWLRRPKRKPRRAGIKESGPGHADARLELTAVEQLREIDPSTKHINHTGRPMAGGPDD